MHFVVAVDASECSGRTLVKAIHFLKNKETDKLTLVHAVEIGKSPVVTAAALVDPLTGDLTTAQLLDRTEKDAESRTVAEHCDRICKKHGVSYDYKESDGDCIEVIQGVVNDVHPDLLVLGTRSQGYVQRLFFGSVSTHFVQHAPCPVLVVP